MGVIVSDERVDYHLSDYNLRIALSHILAKKAKVNKVYVLNILKELEKRGQLHNLYHAYEDEVRVEIRPLLDKEAKSWNTYERNLAEGLI